MVKPLIFAAIILLLAGVAGHFDYEDAKLQEQVYCENVHDGLWPDYQHMYSEVCDGYFTARDR